MENEYAAITVINQILGKWGPNLHFHVISFTTYLFNIHCCNLFYHEFPGMQFQANEQPQNSMQYPTLKIEKLLLSLTREEKHHQVVPAVQKHKIN